MNENILIIFAIIGASAVIALMITYIMYKAINRKQRLSVSLKENEDINNIQEDLYRIEIIKEINHETKEIGWTVRHNYIPERVRSIKTPMFSSVACRPIKPEGTLGLQYFYGLKVPYRPFKQKEDALNFADELQKEMKRVVRGFYKPIVSEVLLTDIKEMK